MEPTSTEALHSLSPEEFESLTRRLFESLGYQVEVTRRSGDEGIDLILDKGDEHSIVQCKRYRGQVGQPVVRDFYGTVVHERAARGYLVTSGTFSLPAQTWAEGKNIVLVDGADLLTSMGHLNLTAGTRSQRPRKGAQNILARVIKRAREEGHRSVFPILFEGEPPSGRSYRELGEALAQQLSLWLVYGDCRSTPIHDSLVEAQTCDEPEWERWREALVFLDEIDEVKGRQLSQLVRAIEDGWETSTPRGYEHRVYKTAATTWGARLPPRLSHLFATKIRSSELDWAFVKESAERWAEEEPERDAAWAENEERIEREGAEQAEREEREEAEQREREKREAAEQESGHVEAKRQIGELYSTKSSVVNVVEPSWENVDYMATHCRFCETALPNVPYVYDLDRNGEPLDLQAFERDWDGKRFRTLGTRTLGGYIAGNKVEYPVPVCSGCYGKLRKSRSGKDKYGRVWWA